MSIKEEIKGREIYLRNKTQKIILPNKDEQENQNNNLKRPIRLTLKHQNRNLKIMTYNSQKLNNELLFSKQEIHKNPEQKQILNTLKNGRTINISSFKKNNVFNPLNRITKTINSNDSKYSKTLNKFHLYPKKNKNYINFVDRNKIRNIKLTTLNIFHQYLNEKSISPKENILKSEFFDNIDSEMNSKRNQKKSKIEFNLYSNNSSKISKSHFKNRLRKLTLNELMDINPYHYVPSKVKFSKVIEMGLISEKLGDMDSGITHHIVKNNVNFFRDKSSKKSKNNRVIDTFQVSYNKNLLHKSGLVWRILQKFYVRRKGINPSFKQACKFKAYTELWKYHSMIIEKLLVNYGKFKWFLEKEKFMREEVFTEFIECKKLESEIKGEITFAKKVFLAFDDTGIGIINIKLFFLVMEITSKYYNILEKINFICDLVEEFELINEKNSINILDMYDLFKNLLVYENAPKDGKGFYESLKEELNGGEKIDLNVYINKNDLYDFLVNNRYFHKILQGFKIQYKYAEANYVEEVNSCFNSTVRNVKKFLNEQNEVISDCQKDYYKFERALKSIQDKNDKLEKLKIFVSELEKDEAEEYQEK
jgi:hypothetical protein